MVLSEDTHYVFHCKVEKVTARSDYTKTEKERTVTEVFNLALNKRDLQELIDLACVGIKLLGTTNG